MKASRKREIKKICKELRKLWEKYPELRFFQLLCMVQHSIMPNTKETNPDCFYIEDLKILEEFKKCQT